MLLLGSYHVNMAATPFIENNQSATQTNWSLWIHGVYTTPYNQPKTIKIIICQTTTHVAIPPWSN